MQKFNPAGIPMNSKQASGIFNVKNPKKYIGNSAPVFRSSWERDFMITCDQNPAILTWVCEPFPIAYTCPLEGKVKQYWPDFLIKYIGADGKQYEQLIEIKPYKQTNPSLVKSKRDKVICIINQTKWMYAYEFCKKNGLEFKVLTEKDLYRK